VEFLRQLRPVAERGRWEEALGSDELHQRIEQLAAIGPPEQRKAWVRQLASEEKGMLRAKFDRFRSMPEQQKQRIRDLHTEVVSADDAGELQQTMFLYRLALNRLPPSLQFEMRKKPLEERIREINRRVQHQRKRSALKLTDEQLLALESKVYRRFREMRSQMAAFQKNLPPRGQAAWKKMPDRQKFQLFLRQSQSSDNLSKTAILQEILDAVVDSLPEDARKQFLARTRRVRQARMLESKSGQRGVVSEQAMEDFFAEELDAQQREQLLAMPRDAMQRELRRLYRGGHPDRFWGRAHGEGPGRQRKHRSPPANDFRRDRHRPDHRRGLNQPSTDHAASDKASDR